MYKEMLYVLGKINIFRKDYPEIISHTDRKCIQSIYNKQEILDVSSDWTFIQRLQRGLLKKGNRFFTRTRYWRPQSEQHYICK